MATVLVCLFLLASLRSSSQAVLPDQSGDMELRPMLAPTLAPPLKPGASPRLSPYEDPLLVAAGLSMIIGGAGRLPLQFQTSPPRTALSGGFLFGAKGTTSHPQGPVPTAQPTAGPTAAPRLPSTSAPSTHLSTQPPQHFLSTPEVVVAGLHPLLGGVFPGGSLGVTTRPTGSQTGPQGGDKGFHVQATWPCTSSRSSRVELSAEDLYGVLGPPNLRLAVATEDQVQDFPNLLALGDSPASVMKKADIMVRLQTTTPVPSPAETDSDTLDSGGVVSTSPAPPSVLGVVNASHALPSSDRIRRSSTGSVSHAEYCLQRGKDMGTNFLSLCTSCAHTTDLGPNVFPRYINEVVCGTSDCIFHRNQPMGRCKQRVFYMKMLRRRSGLCMTVQNGSHRVQSDFWETYDQPIRIACDCMMLRDSAFANFVNVQR